MGATDVNGYVMQIKQYFDDKVKSITSPDLRGSWETLYEARLQTQWSDVL